MARYELKGRQWWDFSVVYTRDEPVEEGDITISKGDVLIFDASNDWDRCHFKTPEGKRVSFWFGNRESIFKYGYDLVEEHDGK